MTISNTRRSGLLFASLVLPIAASATPPSGSDYIGDPQRSYVQDATSRDIGMVNMITCLMSAMRPDAMVNEGPYVAMVDETKCDPEGRSDSTNSGSANEGSQAASYTTAIVNSTRNSNDEPMRGRVWMEDSQDGMDQTIFVNVSATQPPSSSNPYGEFRLDYCGRSVGASACMMNGFLDGRADGVSFYQEENEGEFARTTALRLIAEGTASGSGKLHSVESFENQTQDAEFSFAYDQNYFLRGDQCFARDATDPGTGLSVWRYGLYDETTGARIARNSGFPIEFVHEGTTHHGYLGYQGLQLPPEVAAALANGDSVDKVDYSGGGEPTRTSYEVTRTAGKLLKFEKRIRTLRSMDNIRFNTFIDNNAEQFFTGATPFSQYELYWDDAEGSFIVTGRMNCGETGCHTEEFPGEGQPAVSPAYWAERGGIQGWSNALGGELFINLSNIGQTFDSGQVTVVYRTQDLVYPSQVPQQLYCVQNCPTAASLQAYFQPPSEASPPSPYVNETFNNWNPTPAGNLMVYGVDNATALLRDGVNAAVIHTGMDAFQQHPQYRHGVRSGRLFANLVDAACDAPQGQTGSYYCDWKVSDANVYYQWETGPNPWNQFAAVKNSSGDFIQFDPPLQVNFEVPDAAGYGQYRGKSIVLQYGGFGDLWGIPGQCVSRLTNEPMSCENMNARYVPAFVIPYGETLGRVTNGQTAYLVKWLEREIRFARKDPGICAAAGLTTPDNMTLPTADELKDPSDSGSDIYIGAKPVVTGAPRVIHGEVMY